MAALDEKAMTCMQQLQYPWYRPLLFCACSASWPEKHGVISHEPKKISVTDDFINSIQARIVILLLI